MKELLTNFIQNEGHAQ